MYTGKNNTRVMHGDGLTELSRVSREYSCESHKCLQEFEEESKSPKAARGRRRSRKFFLLIAEMDFYWLSNQSEGESKASISLGGKSSLGKSREIISFITKSAFWEK